MIQLLPMCKNDIDRVMQLDRKSFVQWPRHYYIKTVYSSGFYGILAQTDNQCIGNIMFRINNRCLYIDKIIVSKEYRYQGVGGKLLKKAIRMGKRKNVDQALLTVFYNNIYAMDFYSKHGFLIESIQWNHYLDGEHGVRMYRNV